jgi:PI-3-kinase-related kinase SMG-1
MQGREDLHLDERLTQMLRSANTALQANKLSAYRALHVRTFAVVPLGPKTGLIEWVDFSVPLFGIYQAWQKRSALLPGRYSSFKRVQ